MDPTEPTAPSSPPGLPPGGPAAPVDGPAPPRALARPSAAGFALLLLALLPVALAAQAVQPGPGLVWTQLFLFALPALALPARAGLAPARFLRLTPPPPRALGLALLLGAGALLAGGALQALWTTFLPGWLLQTFDVSRLFRRPPWERAVMIGAAVGLAPLCEELAFRGHLLAALRLRFGPAAAITLSALVFSALHLDPVRLPGLLLLGLLYGWMTWRSGSIYPAVLAHAVNNAAATALALGSDPAEQAQPDRWASLAGLLLGLALLALPVAAFHRWLPPAQSAQSALAPGAAPARRVAGWVAVAIWAAVISLGLIALAPRR